MQDVSSGSPDLTVVEHSEGEREEFGMLPRPFAAVPVPEVPIFSVGPDRRNGPDVVEAAHAERGHRKSRDVIPARAVVMKEPVSRDPNVSWADHSYGPQLAA